MFIYYIYNTVRCTFICVSSRNGINIKRLGELSRLLPGKNPAFSKRGKINERALTTTLRQRNVDARLFKGVTSGTLTNRKLKDVRIFIAGSSRAISRET